MGMPIGASAYARAKEVAVASTTYTLPDLPWAVLLSPIVRDARPGDSVVVYTTAMRAHVEPHYHTEKLFGSSAFHE